MTNLVIRKITSIHDVAYAIASVPLLKNGRNSFTSISGSIQQIKNYINSSPTLVTDTQRTISMIKKLLLTSLMCLPMIAQAKDIGRTHVPVDHIAPIKDPDWRFILIEGGNVGIAYGPKITDKTPYELSKNDKIKIERPFDFGSKNQPYFGIYIPELNNQNLAKSILSLDTDKNNNFVLTVDNKIIKIPTQTIFIKDYISWDAYDFKHVCALDYVDKIQIPCMKKMTKFDGYRKYLIPKNYSKHNNISIIKLDRLTQDKKYYTTSKSDNKSHMYDIRFHMFNEQEYNTLLKTIPNIEKTNEFDIKYGEKYYWSSVYHNNYADIDYRNFRFNDSISSDASQ